MDDLLAPPTKEELDLLAQPQEETDLLAPPTEEELYETPATPSMSESLGRGAAQGVSLGFVDELTGGLEAATEKSKAFIPDSVLKAFGVSDMSSEDFSKLYERFRDESRQKYKEAEEANPGAYLTGELASGLIPGVGTLGALSKAKKATSLAGKVYAGMKSGSALGATQAIGTSEAANTPEMLGEAAKGGVIGGIGGGALQGVLSGVPALGRLIKGSKYGEASAYGKAQIPIYGEAGKTATQGALKKAATNTATDLYSTVNTAFKQKLDILETSTDPVLLKQIYNEMAEDINKSLDDRIISASTADDIMKNLKDKFSSKKGEVIRNAKKIKIQEELSPTGEVIKRKTTESGKIKDMPEGAEIISKSQLSKTEERVPGLLTSETKGPLLGEVDQAGAGRLAKQRRTIEESFDVKTPNVIAEQVPAKRAFEIAKELQNIKLSLRPKGSAPSPEDAKKIDKLQKTIDLLESGQIDKVKELNEEMSNVYKTFESLGINPEEYRNVFKPLSQAEGIDKVIPQLYEATFRKSLPNVGSTRDLNLEKFEENLAKSIGSEKATQRIKEMNEASKLAQMYSSIEGSSGLDVATQVAGASYGALGLKAAHGLGSLMGKASKTLPGKTIDKTINVGYKLAKMPSVRFKAMADSIRAKGGSAKTADLLEQVATTDSDRMRNALLFSLMQNPAYREAIKEEDETAFDKNEEE